jgi:hypothetical protein
MTVNVPEWVLEKKRELDSLDPRFLSYSQRCDLLNDMEILCDMYVELFEKQRTIQLLLEEQWTQRKHLVLALSLCELAFLSILGGESQVVCETLEQAQSVAVQALLQMRKEVNSTFVVLTQQEFDELIEKYPGNSFSQHGYEPIVH